MSQSEYLKNKYIFSRPGNVPTHQFVLFELFAIAERHLFLLLYSS